MASTKSSAKELSPSGSSPSSLEIAANLKSCNQATDTCTSYDTKKGNVLSAAKGPDPPRLPPPRRHARGLQARSRPGCRSCGSRCCRCCWVGVPPGELGATKAGICAGWYGACASRFQMHTRRCRGMSPPATTAAPAVLVLPR
jgi:hypothetical protein